MYQGYTETQEQVKERWAMMCERARRQARPGQDEGNDMTTPTLEERAARLEEAKRQLLETLQASGMFDENGKPIPARKMQPVREAVIVSFCAAVTSITLAILYAIAR